MSSQKRKLSSAENKQKNKRKLLDDDAKGCLDVSRFFIKSSPSATSILSTATSSSTTSTLSTASPSVTSILSTATSSSTASSAETNASSFTNIPDEEKLHECDPASDCIPKNRSLFRDYVKSGPIQPRLSDYPTRSFGNKQRRFQVQWFDKYKWLEYSISKDSAFCFVCRSFGSITSSKSFDTFNSNGYSDWKGALDSGRGFNKHQNSAAHISNYESWLHFIGENPIDAQLSIQREKEINKLKMERADRFEALSRIIDVVTTLARLRLPFRGDDESLNSKNKGIFLEIIELVARYDQTLASHIEKSGFNSKGYPSYLSPSSQNSIITSAASIIRNNLIKEIKQCGYYAICMDTTPDESKTDQLSIIFRYIQPEGNICEVLLGICPAISGDGETLSNILFSFLEKYGFNVMNIRGQGYDGCASMSGKYRGVKSRILQLNNKAYFVHCFAHRINLVVIDTITKNIEARNFFGTINQLYNFIEGSTKRHGLFQFIQKEFNGQQIQEGIYDNNASGNSYGNTKLYTLSSISQTRWSSRADNCRILKLTLPHVKKTLEHITSDSTYDMDTAGTANSLSKSIDFEFCLILCIMADLLELVQVVSKYLQDEKMNISAAASSVEVLIVEIQSKRCDETYNSLWANAELLAESINVQYEEPRMRKVSKRIDDNWANQTVETGKEKLRVSYFQIVDLMVSALTGRFDSTDTLPLLKSIACLENPDASKTDQLMQLAAFYEGDVTTETIQAQYTLLIRLLNNEKIKPNGIQSIYSWMIKTDMVTMCDAVAKLYKLVLILPATSCSNERCFSALKFIKNRLRTTMTQERLDELMILAVEGERTKDLDLMKVRDHFWSMAKRR